MGYAAVSQLYAQKEEKSQRKQIKQLDRQYRDWFDLVEYIVTPLEKKTFLQLTNNRDRDAFINLFWTLRDPTRGTPQNEFKDEHIKRFNHAKKYFGFGTPKPGWKTDRGRIYIILGPPVSVNEVIQNGLRPTLIWDYYGGPKTGLPTTYNIVFYKRHGMGEYEMYIPAVDGPASLLQTETGEVDPMDYETVYRKIHEFNPQVAMISLSLVPGERTYGFNPSLSDTIMLSRISELPKSKINANYARHFLKYKGFVQTSVATNYINIKTDVYTLKDPLLNLNFIHFAVLPERLSVDYSKSQDKYYFNFNVMAILKKGEDIIYEHEKKFPLYYSKEELEAKLSNGIIIADYFPVIEGKYKLIILVQNALNNELSYFEKDVEIAPANSPEPKIYGPVVSYQVERVEQQLYAPFNIMGTNIKIDPARSFGTRDMLSALFSVDRGEYSQPVDVLLEIESMDENRPFIKKYNLEFPADKKFWLFTQFLDNLGYGNYTARAKLLDKKGTVLDLREKNFQVSPKPYVAHPPLASKRMQKRHGFIFYLNTASQHQNNKNNAMAEVYYKKALSMNPNFAGTVKTYAAFLMQQERYPEVLKLIENIGGQEKEAFDYFSFKGRALFRMKDYNSAVGALLEANKIYDSDLTVINTLGFGLIRIGEKREAARALAASLKLDPQQKDILKIYEQLKQEIETSNAKQ